MEFQPGERVWVFEHGVGKVKEVLSQAVVVEFGSGKGTLRLPRQQLSDLVRKLVDEDEAGRWLQVLCSEPSGDAPNDEPSSHTRFRRSSLDVRLAWLQRYSRRKSSIDSDRAKDVLKKAYEGVIDELAISVGCGKRALKLALEHGDPALAVKGAKAPAIREPSEAPEIEGASYFDTFLVAGGIVVGERPELDGAYGLPDVDEGASATGGRARIAAAAGWWHGYHLDNFGGYMALHESVGADLDLTDVTEGPSVVVRRGSLTLLSSKALDHYTMNQIHQRKYGDHGAEFGTKEEEGTLRVDAGGPDGARTLILIRF